MHKTFMEKTIQLHWNTLQNNLLKRELYWFPRAAIINTTNGCLRITEIYSLTIPETRNPKSTGPCSFWDCEECLLASSSFLGVPSNPWVPWLAATWLWSLHLRMAFFSNIFTFSTCIDTSPTGLRAHLTLV